MLIPTPVKVLNVSEQVHTFDLVNTRLYLHWELLFHLSSVYLSNFEKASMSFQNGAQRVRLCSSGSTGLFERYEADRNSTKRWDGHSLKNTKPV